MAASRAQGTQHKWHGILRLWRDTQLLDSPKLPDGLREEVQGLVLVAAACQKDWKSLTYLKKWFNVDRCWDQDSVVYALACPGLSSHDTVQVLAFVARNGPKSLDVGGCIGKAAVSLLHISDNVSRGVSVVLLARLCTDKLGI
jgi:hypothetical protein